MMGVLRPARVFAAQRTLVTVQIPVGVEVLRHNAPPFRRLSKTDEIITYEDIISQGF